MGLVLRCAHFKLMAKIGVLWDKMAILCPIGLKIGLPITLDKSDG